MNKEYEEFVELGLNILVNFVGNLSQGFEELIENEICGRSRDKKLMVLLNFVGNLGDLRGWGIYV